MSQVVHDRILAVRDQWLSFCDQKEARVLCWSIEEDGYDLLETFLEFESGEAKELPHLFIPFKSSFAEPAAYDAALLAELREYVTHLADDEESPENLPSLERQKYTAVALAKIQSQEEGFIEEICGTLFPEKKEEAAGVIPYLRQVLTPEKWPEGVRFMVLDNHESPQLAELVEEFPDIFVVEKLSANMAELAKDIAHENPASGPGPDFQKAYTDLNAASSKGDAKEARAAAKRADKIAEKEDWPGMRVAVSLNLGGACVKSGEDLEAMDHYRQAEKHAVVAKEKGEPGSDKLIYQSLLSQASIHIKKKQFSYASPLYQRAAKIAEELEEHLMAMEGWRMASYCHEYLADHREPGPYEKLGHDENLEHSWDFANLGIAQVELMEEDARKASTLPYLGAGMVRITDRTLLHSKKPGMEKTLHKLMGDDWEKQIEQTKEVPK